MINVRKKVWSARKAESSYTRIKVYRKYNCIEVAIVTLLLRGNGRMGLPLIPLQIGDGVQV